MAAFIHTAPVVAAVFLAAAVLSLVLPNTAIADPEALEATDAQSASG
jgi:hypothetical protein